MSTDYKVCVRDEYGEFDSWEAWQKFHRDRKDIDRLSEYVKALKEENKRLREALEEMIQRYDAAEESSEIWDGPDYLGSYNMFQAECSEIIGIARSALKEE